MTLLLNSIPVTIRSSSYPSDQVNHLLSKNTERQKGCRCAKLHYFYSYAYSVTESLSSCPLNPEDDFYNSSSYTSHP